MSILTNGNSGRASKRRKLSVSPKPESDASSSDEGPNGDMTTRRQESGPRQKSNRNGAPGDSGNGSTKSSVIALQVSELLSATNPNLEKLEVRLQPIMNRIRQVISEIPERPAMLISEARKALKSEAGVEIPLGHSRPAKDIKYKFAYKCPRGIQRSESVAHGSSGSSTIILAVQMPEELFQEKDYLNYRAFHKRSFYLACIAAGIKKAAPDEFELHFEAQDDIDLIPVLTVNQAELSPEGSLQPNLGIRITVIFPETVIPIEKTLPTKYCVRDTIAPPNELKYTALYNSCARSLAYFDSLQKLLSNAANVCVAFTDTARLASTWMQQRGMGSSMSQGGFGQEEWKLLCALLLQTGGHHGQPLLLPRYTSIQLFKATLQFLTAKDLMSPMITRSALSQLPKTGSPTLYDGALGINVLHKMTTWSYQALREEASLTLAAINARNEDNFDPTFIVRAADPILKFDELYDIEVLASASSEKIFEILTEGLGDRVKRISICAPPLPSWRIDRTYDKSLTISASIGLFLVPENKDRLVDHGPSAEDQEDAAKFRAFWGEKAELRRFKDGSIVESLVWSEDTPISAQIINYLFEMHFGVSAKVSLSIANRVESIILDQSIQVKQVDAFKLLNNAYQSLTTQLHHLEDLPLRIRSITPADAQLSSSSLILPLTSIHSAPADIYIEFENSTRWPDHLPAIQHTKIAFLTKLGEVMQAAHAELITRVGLENTETASSGHLNTSYLDIIYPSSAQGLTPISFRLRITHDREVTLIEKALASKSLTTPAQTTMSNALQQQKRTLAMQKHTMMLRNLTTRFPALSSTIRLLKKWASSHRLPPSLLLDPILDLLCIHAFTHPAPWSTPASVQTAFLRTLHTISRWDWASEPLLIDISLDGSLFASAPVVEHLRTRFVAWRKLDPSMNNVVLFVGSNLDPTGVVWTQGQQPPRVVAGRLTALAKASIAVVREKGSRMQESDWRGLFQSPLGDFDFLIHLKMEFGGKEGKTKGSGKFKNLQLQESMDEESIGFDPAALFVQDLERTFGESLLFFYDRDGGKVIAGLWNPKMLEKKDFRVRLGVSSMPVAVAKGGDESEKDKVIINQASILAEISLMGEGLVQKIEVVKDLLQ